jgi:hypothetical protein
MRKRILNTLPILLCFVLPILMRTLDYTEIILYSTGYSRFLQNLFKNVLSGNLGYLSVLCTYRWSI